MNDEEKAEFDKKLEEKSNKEYYPAFKDFGFVGSIFLCDWFIWHCHLFYCWIDLFTYAKYEVATYIYNHIHDFITHCEKN